MFAISAKLDSTTIPCLLGLSLWTPSASTTGEQIDRLFFSFFAICLLVGLLVAVLLFYFCIRYRRRPDEIGNPPPSRQSHFLEWSWTISPMAVFVFFFVWGGGIYLSTTSPPPESTPVYVVAKQWMWKFQHPEGQREINTLHVPVGQPVKLLLVSEDVIHSFFVPAFRLHMDVLPGRYTSVWFEATTPGRYELFCSQYCGTNHSRMTGEVVAMKPEDYQQWLTLRSDGSLAKKGQQLFLKYRCLSCHSADHNARAPVLENLFESQVALGSGGVIVADRDYLRRSILNPSADIVAGFQDIMPPFEGQINEEEINALIAYLRSLEAGDTPPRVENYPPPAKTPSIPTDMTE